MGNATILIVDQEPNMRRMLRERLSQEGYDVREAATAVEAIHQLTESVPNVVLLDFALADVDGPALLHDINEHWPDSPVILMTGFSSIEQAVESMNLGAYQCVNKPFNVDDVAFHVDKAVEASRLRREIKELQRHQQRQFAFDVLLGASPVMLDLRARIEQLAQAGPATVLLQGETGTGKNLVARILHYNSSQAAGPFIEVRCAGRDADELNRVLFGEPGDDGAPFRRGALEAAHGGTVLIDSIEQMPPAAQAQLEAFLESRRLQRSGGEREAAVDVMMVATAHQDLDALVRRQGFRADLADRLRVAMLALPPLRERPGDVPRFVRHYMALFNDQFNKQVTGVTPAAMQALEDYPWPGNVLELRNVIEHAMLLIEGVTLEGAHLKILGAPAASSKFQLPLEGVRLEDLERQLLVQALERCKGNQTQAGELLGINRDQVRYRIEKFRLAET